MTFKKTEYVKTMRDYAINVRLRGTIAIMRWSVNYAGIRGKLCDRVIAIFWGVYFMDAIVVIAI